MDWILIAMFALLAVSCLTSIYFSITGKIELQSLIKEIKLKIRELKIKEIELNR